MRRKSDSLRCSAESEGSGSDWKGVIRLSDIRQKGKIKKHKIVPTLTKDNEQGDTQPLIVEDFYKARSLRKYKNAAPALRSDRTGLKVVSGLSQSRGFETRKDELSHAIKGAGGGSSKNFVASGQTTTTDMPAKSIGKGSETKNSSRATSVASPQARYLSMTFLQQDFPAKLFPLRENARVFRTGQGELFSTKSAELLEIKNQAIYSLRMLKDYFLTIKDEPSQLYSFRWMSLGMMRNGRCLTLSIGYPRTGRGSLSSVLEEKVDEKYSLSETTLKKIMEKKDAHPDIKWKSGIRGEGKVQFPDRVDKPSRAITPAEGGANRMTHGVMVLADILEEKVDEKYHLSEKAIRFLERRNIENEKSNRGFKADIQDGNKPSRTIDARYGGIRNSGETYLLQIGNIDRKGHNSLWGRVYSPEGISANINAEGGGLGAKTGLYMVKDNLIIANTVTPDAYLARGKRERVKGKAVLTSMCKRRIRRLTPKECERLQGFPDDWTRVPAVGNDAGTTYDYETGETTIKGKVMSDTQRYKMMGNAISTPVVEAIGRKILEVSRE